MKNRIQTSDPTGCDFFDGGEEYVCITSINVLIFLHRIFTAVPGRIERVQREQASKRYNNNFLH